MKERNPDRHRNYEELGSLMLFPVCPDSTLLEALSFIKPQIYKDMCRRKDPNILKYRLLRKQVLNILGLKDLSEAPTLFKDEARKKTLNENFINMITKQYGIRELDFAEREALVGDAFRLADRVVDRFEHPENGLFKQYHTAINITDEVRAINNTIDLILLMFSPRASQTAQYEARRKLALADISLRVLIDKQKKENVNDDFLRILNTHLFNGIIGTSANIEILSTHSPKNYEVTKICELRPNEKIDKKDLGENTRYTRLGIRYLKIGDKSIPVNIDWRTKSDEDIVIKLMRKNEKNPRIIDDYFGAKMVFRNKKEIYLFLEEMQTVMAKLGICISYDDVSDTIEQGCRYQTNNHGSSTKLEIIKAHFILNGQRIELQLHTLKSFLDYRYHKETGFETAYLFNRLFDSGVVDMMYPENVYNISHQAIKKALIKHQKNQICDTARLTLSKKRVKK